MAEVEPGRGTAHEAAPAGEEAMVAGIVAAIRRRYLDRYQPAVRPARRDQHAKQHGCALAELTVPADLPYPVRHGLFAEPGTHHAVIRFSASSPDPKPDTRRDARAMAIKVLDVPGEKVLPAERDATTQDFILANSKVFFCRDVPDYIDLTEALDRGRFPLFFFPTWKPWRWRLLELRNLLAAVGRRVSNPLEIQYWSQTPYALGPHAVKYSARPTEGVRKQRAAAGPDSLEEVVAAHLATRDASFDFFVQLRTNPRTMPVEDAAVVWKERASPFIKVATCRIPAQDITTPARRAFAEHLSYTPWHALPAHRPLGGINRTRRAAYEAMSELRHELNGVARGEPTFEDVP
jgi:hypothetical protein